MAVTAVIGTGLAVTFSGVTYPILSMDGPNLTRASIEASKMATTSYHDFLPGSLVDPGDLTLEVEYDGNLPLTALAAAASTMIINYSSTGYATCTAFMTGFSPSIPLEDKMTATCSFKVTTTIVASS